MARTKTQGNGRLEEAIAKLVHYQASFSAWTAEMDRINSERFARIEHLLLEHSRILAEHSRILAEHSRILADHTRILEALPETIRQKSVSRRPYRPRKPCGSSSRNPRRLDRPRW